MYWSASRSSHVIQLLKQARRELEALQSESRRESDRLSLEYQAQIDTAQSQLEKERNETRQTHRTGSPRSGRPEEDGSSPGEPAIAN